MSWRIRWGWISLMTGTAPGRMATAPARAMTAARLVIVTGKNNGNKSMTAAAFAAAVFKDTVESFLRLQNVFLIPRF